MYVIEDISDPEEWIIRARKAEKMLENFKNDPTLIFEMGEIHFQKEFWMWEIIKDGSMVVRLRKMWENTEGKREYDILMENLKRITLMYNEAEKSAKKELAAARRRHTRRKKERNEYFRKLAAGEPVDNPVKKKQPKKQDC